MYYQPEEQEQSKLTALLLTIEKNNNTNFQGYISDYYKLDYLGFDVQHKEENKPKQKPKPTLVDGMECMNCKTRNTPLWRRHPMNGSPICNACGLFLKLHGKLRPLSLKTDVIKKRKRRSTKK